MRACVRASLCAYVHACMRAYVHRYIRERTGIYGVKFECAFYLSGEQDQQDDTQKTNGLKKNKEISGKHMILSYVTNPRIHNDSS